MTLQSSGKISMANINSELGLSSSTTISLNQTNVRKLLGRTTNASTISMSDAYGKSNAIARTYDATWSSSGTFTVPSNFVSFTSMTVYIVGGGGQGAGWPSGSEGAGGGEGASLTVSSSAFSFYAGQQFTITVGSGGTSTATNGQSGNAGGASTFGAGTTLATTARGGLGGSTSPSIRNLTANTNTNSGGLARNYYLGGATSGRFGAAQAATYSGGGGASNCYDGNGDGVYNEGGSSWLNQIFSGTNVGYGGAGCGGGDHRISNQGYWPGGGGGGADYNATGGNGANGAIRVIFNYMG